MNLHRLNVSFSPQRQYKAKPPLSKTCRFQTSSPAPSNVTASYVTALTEIPRDLANIQIPRGSFSLVGQHLQDSSLTRHSLTQPTA